MRKWVRPYRDDVIRLYIRILTVALFYVVLAADDVAPALLEFAGSENDDVARWLTWLLRFAGLSTFALLMLRDQEVESDGAERHVGLLPKVAFGSVFVTLVAWVTLVQDILDVSAVEKVLLIVIPLATAIGGLIIVVKKRREHFAQNQ